MIKLFCFVQQLMTTKNILYKNEPYQTITLLGLRITYDDANSFAAKCF